MAVNPTAVEADAMSDVMPGEAVSSQEIERRTEHAVQVMPLMTDDEMRRTWRLAQTLAASSMFKDGTKAEQAFTKILIGRDLGLSPTRALMTIDLVKGAIQLRGVLLAAWVRQSEDYDYKIIEHDHTHCVVRFLGSPSAEPYDESSVRHRGQFWEVLDPDIAFTIEDATRAGLVKEDSNWEKYPEDMCFWRAMSRGVKRHAPELFAGMPVYVEGEVVPEPTPVSKPSADPAVLPEVLTQLLDRARAIDSLAWRRNEVVARLPHPAADEYQPAVDGIVAELKKWLAEREPQDAEVVDEPQSLQDVESEQQPAEQPVDATAEEAAPEEPTLDERYHADADWRLQVDVLLTRRADLESALDECAGGTDQRQVDEYAAELANVNGDLDALGVPEGWFPASTEQTTFEV